MTYVGTAAKAIFVLVVNLMALFMTWFLVVATYGVVASLAGSTPAWIAGGVVALVLFLLVWLDDAVAIGQSVVGVARRGLHATHKTVEPAVVPAPARRVAVHSSWHLALRQGAR